jgi:hypothetical protein
VAEPPPAEDEEEVRVLVAAPNMTFDAVVEGSTVDLAGKTERDDGSWLAQPHGKHVFRLAHPTLGFQLMPSRFSLIEASGQQVFRVRSTPQLSYATFGQAFGIVEALHDKFAAVGWEPRDRQERRRLEQRFRRGTCIVACVYSPLPDIREKAEPLPRWRIDVEVRKAGAGSPSAAALGIQGDAFLVTAVLANEPDAP